mmetsp:Transcript_17950/g.25846  ORF Transcript_17950/g.25846 Transcript_17950/m.25846 type:complete len:433 (+) Transcript_17950:213-1511(+)
MSSLPSQSALVSTPVDFPTLTGIANYAVFRTAVNDHLASNYGEIGQHILTNTAATLHPPGARPHYNDLRSHPSTGVPIPNSRLYQQVNKTPDEAANAAFDSETLALTADATRQLDNAIQAWIKREDTYNARVLLLRTLDDSCFNFLCAHIDRNTKDTLTAHPDMVTFKQLPGHCVTRSDQYLKIVEKQFSSGNSTVTINEVTKWLSITQGPKGEDTTAAFSNRIIEQRARILPTLQKCASVEEMITMFTTMIFIKGLDKTQHQNLRALEIYIQTYKGHAAMQNFPTLQADVLAAQHSDLSNLPDNVSEQSAAFAANLIPPANPHLATPKDSTHGLKPKNNGKPHCPHCFTAFTRYYYHSADICSNNPTNKKTHPTSKKTPYAKLSARLAAMETAAATTSSPLPSLLQPSHADRTYSKDEMNALFAETGFQLA